MIRFEHVTITYPEATTPTFRSKFPKVNFA